MKALLAAGALALATPPAPAPFLGVTTQFGQGWPQAAWRIVPPSRIGLVRDAVAWGRIERERGRFAFDAANVGHIDRACGAGRRVLMVLVPRNPLYDDGHFVDSAEGGQAFGRFAAALADRYGACLAGFEIGNEVNAANAIDGTAAAHPILSYVATVRAVHDAVKPGHPALPILGGSSNTIAIGFMQRLFAAGMLRFVDGVAIHPYRHDPANVDWEVARLGEAMRHAGRVVPIWATEFSTGSPDPREAARVLVETSLLLASQGVSHAVWYALIDQPKFPTMGLYKPDGSPKPAALAYDQLARELGGSGAVVRLASSPDLFRFRLPSGTQVIWGAPRALSITGPAQVRDASGGIVTAPSLVGDEPLFVSGAARIAVGTPTVIADSRNTFGRSPWSYGVSRDGSAPLALAPIDWNWTSYVGDRALPGLAVSQGAIAIAPRPAPVTVHLRYVTQVPLTAFAAACVDPGRHPPVTFAIATSGRAPEPPVRIAARTVIVRPVRLAPGGTIDFAVSGSGGAPVSAAYRFRIVTTPASAPDC